MTSAGPPAPGDDAPAAPPPALPGLVLAAIALALFALAVIGLALHPAFQPTYTLRAAAPAVAILVAAAFAHQVARRRARIDVPGRFDPGARALYLGLVMVAVALAAWLDAAQAVPALVNGAIGAARSEPAVVTERAPAADDPACPHRLSVASASVERPMDQCVATAVWAGAAVGGRVTLDLRASRLGAEIVGVRP
jgi:hypothetical protein